MKIKISSGTFKMTLHIPMRVAVSFMKRKADKSEKNADIRVSEVVKELKKARKNFGKMKIVDINSSNGDKVEITL